MARRMMLLLFTAAVVIVGIAVATGPATADTYLDQAPVGTGFGPIPIRDARPYNLIFLQFMPETGDVLRGGQERWGIQLDLINNLLIPPNKNSVTVVEDNEYQRILGSWHRGIGHGSEIAVYLPVEWRDGGFMDPILQAYEHLIGLPASAEDDPLGRPHWPKYRSILEVIDPAGNVVLHYGNGFGVGETNVTFKQAILPATSHSALAARLGLKIPTGNPTVMLGSGSVDEGIMLDGRYSIRPDMIFYGNLGAVFMGPARRIPGAQREMMQSFAGFEYLLSHRSSIVAQIDWTTTDVVIGNYFADRINVTCTFGYQREIAHHLVMNAGFSENGDIFNYTMPYVTNVGPDFTVSTGLQWR